VNQKQFAPRIAARLVRLHARLLISAVIGLAVLLALLATRWWLPTKLLIGWNVGIALYLLLTHVMMSRASVARIRKRAAQQDEGAVAILMLTIIATLASLVAIAFEMGGSKHTMQGGLGIMHALLAMATILLSWSFVHTIFALHYAHEYYGERGDGKIGGLSFPGDETPDYWDFVYFSVVIGMTSQVSDVAITSKVIRRLVAVHGALSFFFNVSVLALTVNMVSNLVQGA
jgi:uncharacterized membrane protein